MPLMTWQTLDQPTNGHQEPPKPQLSLLESEDRERGRFQRMLMESFYGPFGDGFGGGSDTYFDLFQDRYGDPSGGYFVPISVPSDRKAGANWPLWRNDVELGHYRQRSRIICRKNSYARSLLFNLQTHIIGKGFTYNVQAKQDRDTSKVEPGVQVDDADKQTVQAAQKFVDEFLSLNRFTATVTPNAEDALVASTREWEACRRVFRDGEGIIRLFHLDEGERAGMTLVRFVEPEQLVNPGNGTEQEGWSYGMRHAIEPFVDEETIEAYYVRYKDIPSDGTDGEEVPAEEIVHIKNLDEDGAVKRGLPLFSLDAIDALERASKLMRNVSASSAVRAATAEIWQHEQSSQAQVESMASRGVERTYTNPVTGKNETNTRIRPGSTRRIPAGQKPVWPQAVGAAEHLEVLQGDLRQVGSIIAAPEYMTGDASNANFASSREAGAPFVIGGEVTQNHFKVGFQVVVLKAIKFAVRAGRLPSNTLDVIELQVTAPTISVRDPLQTAQEDQILINAKIKSVQTAQGERGLDPDHEAANFEEFDAKFGQAGGALPMPGDEGANGGTAASDPFAGMFGESLLENFTGIDAHGHRWENGQQVAREDKPATKSDLVASWAGYAAKIPAKAYHAAKTRVAAKYQQLEGRYGRSMAVAIMTAGVAGLPLPVPGSSLITAAPVIAVAELIRHFKGPLAPTLIESEELSQEEIERLGKEWIEELLAEAKQEGAE